MKVNIKTLATKYKWIFRFIIAAIAIFIYFVILFFAPNILPANGSKSYLKIPDNSTFDDVLKHLETDANVISLFTFKQAAAIIQYGDKIRPGRYEITPGMSNFGLLRKLRSGRQTPLNLTFNNLRTKTDLAGSLSSQIMADSLDILKHLNDTAFLSKYDLTPETSVCLFIPNTYEVFWDMDVIELFERMNKEYQAFWTDDRKAAAAAIPLSLTEVSTLASIVEEESNANAERPTIAGLYLNRIKQGMPLQADPTVKYAVGNFGLKRINSTHTAVKSPYNTYQNTGLPPGPIRIASSSGIKAVLNYEKHDYIFMCAKETFDGTHNFAATWEEHQRNARKYQQALDARNIH